jgi:hypothetical protein
MWNWKENAQQDWNELGKLSHKRKEGRPWQVVEEEEELWKTETDGEAWLLKDTHKVEMSKEEDSFMVTLSAALTAAE